jgi:hypothetical protein
MRDFRLVAGAASRRVVGVGYYIIDARDTRVNQFPSRQNPVEFGAVLNVSGVTNKRVER